MELQQARYFSSLRTAGVGGADIRGSTIQGTASTKKVPGGTNVGALIR
jgi:hypothetical protein